MSRHAAKAKRLLAAAALAALLVSPQGDGAQAQGGGGSIITDAEIENILREYTDPIFRTAGLAPEDVKIYIAGDKDLNAGVAGGQNMLLNTGLIIRTKNPNELIGVIAHETGHMALAHLARRDEAMPAALATRMITYGLGVLAAVAAPDPRAAVGLFYSADYFAALQLASYTRVQESAADQAAAKYLEASGQSGRGLADFFENLRSQEVFSEARRYAYFRSHPLSGDRIDRLTAKVQAGAHYNKPDSPELIEKHKIMVAKLRGFMNFPVQTFQEYPDTDQSYPARYARAIAYYKNSEIDRSFKEIDLLIAESPKNPYLHELKAQFLFESGKVAESEAPYRRSVELAPNEPLLRTPFGQTLLAINREGAVDEAITVLEKGVALERDNPMAWRLLAEAYERKGDAGMARLAVAEQNFALGQLPSARQFGIRARELLAEGTPQYRRAIDIINASETSLMRRPRS